MRAKKQAMNFYPITVASAVHMDGTDKNLKDDYSEFKSEIEQVRTATTGEKFDTMNERIDLEIGRLKKGFTDVNLIEQDSKERHSIQNTCEGSITDLIIKGRTLKNLVDKNTYNKETEYEFNSKYKRVLIGQYINCGVNGTCFFKVSITKLSECTISVDHDTKPFIITFLGNVEGCDKNHLTVKQWKDLKIGETIVVEGEIQLKINNENRLLIYIGIGINFEVTDSGSTGRFKVNNCVVTKDMIPYDFFEDIESFGQKEDKISILSSGKNFFSEYDTAIFVPKGEYVVSSSVTEGAKRLRFKCEKDDLSNFGGMYYDAVGNYQTHQDSTQINNLTFTVTRDCYLTFKYLNGLEKPYNNIQLEKGRVSTTYEPYKQDKKDILLSQYGFNEGLRGIGIVADELNYIRKVAIKRIEKDTFNGKDEEGWLYVPAQSQGNTAYFQSKFLDSKIKFPEPQLIADTLNTGTLLWDKKDDFEGINIESNDTGFYCLRIRILKSKLSTIDIDGLKAWLKTNPVTLYYELAEPIETPLKEIIELSSYNDTTYVSFENNIRGTSSFKLPVDISKTLLTLVDGKESLENTVDDLSNEINQIKTYMIQMLSK